VSKPERIQQIKHLYQAALERAPDERAAFLAEACPEDEALRCEVAALLVYEERTESFLETPAVKWAAGMLAKDKAVALAGREIGTYRIQSLLGAGGMGEVWLAQDSRLGRKVALKLLPARFTLDQERVRRFMREARAASALNHPNIVTIYEIGTAPSEQGKLHFIAQEFIDGVTLRQRLLSGRLNLTEALDIAAQTATALAAAHEAGIIHRDIKPENLMLRRDGFVKVLDFGLAKLTERQASAETETLTDSQASHTTTPGLVMGTIRYMSPEQARGLKVDARSDLFSLGIVLYEMIAGRAPFEGETPSDGVALILTAKHQPLQQLDAAVPGELERIVSKALAKEREHRYQAAADLVHDLKTLREELEFEAKLSAHSSGFRLQRVLSDRLAQVNWRSRNVWLTTTVLLLLLVSSGWFIWRQANRRWATAQLPRIAQLAQARQPFEAYQLAVQAERYLPGDATLAKWMPLISEPLTVTTEPAGARVYLKRFAPDSSREFIGTTPLRNQRVARGEYLLSLEKESYTPFERTISSKLYQYGTTLLPPDDPTRVEQRLIETARLPERMVFVPGSNYKLVSWRRPTNAGVTLDDYFIDKYEVTNREFKEFVVAGGYLKKQYWQQSFVTAGPAWEEAIKSFKDRTGLPGPRNWAGQDFPAGRAEHPVTDITWYEAAAYAAFRGKQLPTVFQWEKAARNGLFTYYSGYILPWGPIDVVDSVEGRANFKSGGTVPVGSYVFGMSPFGCHDMAGNVAEWCLNETASGFATVGASWDDHPYLFPYIGEQPGLVSNSKLGFRCVRSADAVQGDQGGGKLQTARQVPVYTPVSEVEYRGLLSHYRYDRTQLDVQVTNVHETGEWRRERITYHGANDEQAVAYLYLPKTAKPPFQVLQFVPAGDVYGGFVTLPEAVEMVLTPYIRAGRAVFTVVFKGFKERERAPNYAQPSDTSVKRREELVAQATDLRRGLDYLAERSEIDLNRLAYFGFSQGATEGVIFTSIEERYRAVVLMAGGMWPQSPTTLAEVTRANFVPFIRVPKLMLNGRYDEVHQLTTLIEPLYRLMREPKKLVLYDGSHTPPIEIAVPVINGWLDETLGPVRRE
jgi:eukaryotic-like serine/threonine-protein kinase